MAEPRAKTGNCHGPPASTPSGVKVNDRAVLYEGRFGIFLSVDAIMDFGRPLNNATTGWIESDAEPGFRKHSISGWKRGCGSLEIMDSAVYCARVFEVARDIQFHIENHRFDNNWKKALPEHKGRFKACHVEKFLTVWWLEKVLFFCFKTKNLSRIHELRDLELPARMARATVFLNHEPCENCLGFLDEIHRLTGIRVSTREISFLEPSKRERAQEYPHHEENENEGAEEAVEEDIPETPRPTVPRKLSDPKIAKELTYSSPPTTWDRYPNCAKPRTTKATLDEMRQMYRGVLPPSQVTTMSRPTEHGSRSVHGNPDSSEPSSQSEDETMQAATQFEDETMQDAENQHLSENDRHCSDSSSMSPFPGARHLQSIPSSQLEVNLRPISPRTRAQYRRVEIDEEIPRQPSLSRLSKPSSPASVLENNTTPPPRPVPDLKRFIYGGGTVTPAKRPMRKRTRKPTGLTRAEKARKKSTFLKAANRAEIQRAQVQEGLGGRDQPSVATGGGGDADDDVSMVPVSGTGNGGADDDDVEMSMVPVHPTFMQEYGLDVVMG